MDVAQLFDDLVVELKAYADDQVEARVAAAVQKISADMLKTVDSAVEKAVLAIPKPRDGKDAEPVDMAALRQSILKEIPAPKDGKDAPPVDVEKLKADILKALPSPQPGRDGKDADEEALYQRLLKQIPEPIHGKDGTNGINGKDADEEAITKKVLASIVVPTPRDGIDGKDVDPLLVAALVKSEVAEQVKGIKPENGRDGKDFDPALMREYVDVAVSKAIQQIPKALDGKDGQSVTVDDVAPLLSAELDKKEIELERRAEVIVQRAVDRIPKAVNGKDGQDALRVDDLFVELSEDSRTIKIGLQAGERQVVKAVKLPIPIYRDVYKSTAKYERGDSVTYGGSTWIAMRDGPGVPGAENSGWKLAVQRGK